LPLNRRLALSSVISSIILSAAVLVVGGMIWNYANGASSVIASQYHDESMDMVDQLKERFMVEHVNNSATHLTVWVYNYGDVDVEVVIYANNDDVIYNSDQDNPISVVAESSVKTTFEAPSSSGDSIGINIYSRRQNSVYYSYIAQ
jgi:acylphosphatase